MSSLIARMQPKVKTVAGGKVTEYELGEAAVIDATLSQAGEAADAKAAGDAITALSGANEALADTMEDLQEEVFYDKTVSMANPATNTTGGLSLNVIWCFHLPGIYSESITVTPIFNKTSGTYYAKRFHSASGTFAQNDPLTHIETKSANIGESVLFENVTPNDVFAFEANAASANIKYCSASSSPSHDVPFGYVYDASGGMTGPFTYKTSTDYFAADQLDVVIKASSFNLKLNKNQGAENAGKTLKVGSDGNIEPVSVSIPVVDSTLLIAGDAADAKEVGDILLDKPYGPEITWTKGYEIDITTGSATIGQPVANSRCSVTSDFIVSGETPQDMIFSFHYPTDPTEYESFGAHYRIITYESDGTYLGYEMYGFKTSPFNERMLKPGYKYKFVVMRNNGPTDQDYYIAMTDFHWKYRTEDKIGLITRVGTLEDGTALVNQLDTQVNGGGEHLSFFIEKGGISATTGEDDSSSTIGRSIGYYESNGDNIIISVPVGGRCFVFEYSDDSAEDFVRMISPSNTNGITYVSSPYTLETTSGYFYRFTFKLNDDYTWQDGQEFFKDFTFILASTAVEGLGKRVTALEQASGSDKLFTGKKCVTLGDSITYRNVWQPVVNDALGMTMVNKGVGGTSIAGGDTNNSSMSSNNRLNGVLAESPDYVTILGGANDLYSADHTAGYPIGDESEFEESLANKDRQTFLGAYSYIIEYLLGHDPTLNIMILGTTWGHSDGRRFSEDRTLTMYSEASKKVAQYYGLPFVDLHGECGFNAFTMGSASANQIYSSDQIHPNTAGGKRIASLVIAKMIEAWKYTLT